jgi:hypothetical protein
MSLAIKRLTVYLRASVVVLVVGAIGLVLFENRSYTVRLWFFGLTDADKPVNVVWVMVWTAGFTRAAWWVISFTRGLVCDFRELKRQRALIEAELEHQKRAAEMDERERRIEEKLKRAAGDETEGNGESGSGPRTRVEGEAR